MSRLFEELDYRPTPIGPLSLRRRHILPLKVDVVEIILGDEHLMSSLFTASEVALSKLALDELSGETLDIVVGGLGLGYTAAAALEDPRVSALTVVELLEPVVDWHAAGLLPLDPPLSADPRCTIHLADFFALARSDKGFDPAKPGRQHDAILIDIDHSPDWLLHEQSRDFYSQDGLASLAQHLKPGGIMGLWSDATTYPAFTAHLGQVFDEAWATPVTFDHPVQGTTFTQTVYLARKAA